MKPVKAWAIVDKERINEQIRFWLQARSMEWYPDEDYFTDEAANARLLEAMRRPLYVSDWPGCEGWRVDIGVEHYQGKPKGPTHLDRKTAIVLAFLKYMEANPK